MHMMYMNFLHDGKVCIFANNRLSLGVLFGDSQTTSSFQWCVKSNKIVLTDLKHPRTPLL